LEDNLAKFVCHLRFCRLIYSETSFDLIYRSETYRIGFIDTEFEEGKGVSITWNINNKWYINFKQWLSIYVGEDFVDPFQEIDTRFNSYRGNFPIKRESLQMFLIFVENGEKKKSTPKWKTSLRESSVMYYMVGISLGVRYMPMSIGYFALSLECIGNFKYGKRDKHWTLGEKKFLALLAEVLVPHKKNPITREAARKFEKMVHADIGLLNEMRNAFYGHSLMHLQRDKSRIVKSLREWMIRNGFSSEHAKMHVPFGDIKIGIMASIPALYKLGLRLNRLFLFYSFGISDPPFATHDFRYLADHINGEVSRHQGVRTTASIVQDKDGKVELRMEMSHEESSK
jgi:hypothetical protein